MILKPIPGLPDYFAGEDGNIYSNKKYHSAVLPPSPRLVKSRVRRPGYRMCDLQSENGEKRYKTALLVCTAFHGPRPTGMECCHGPGGKTDDRPVNISWGTHQKNMSVDRVRDGTDNRGEKCGTHKLTAAEVQEIRAQWKGRGSRWHRPLGGKYMWELAKEFGVSRVQIKHIVDRTEWQYLSDGTNG